MATTVVDQNLVNIKEIEWYDKTSILRVGLNECQFPTANGVIEWRKAYTLTIPKLPSSIASVTITRTSSEMTGVTTTTWTAGSTEQNVEVRYGDVLTITATKKTGYTTPVFDLSLVSGSGSGGSGGTETGAYCGCCGTTDNLVYIEGSGYVCEDCYASWG